uniref:DNA-directed RNA polymerase RpoA/D/Rpb3-type domain-containing protein n=1 Tax=viral metagenome TaxID=1070528 RepID=A0A6C0LCI7_9ZZZZ
MNPKIEKVSDADGTLRFTLSGVNVSIANSLRRTILSDIRQVVFKTAPYEENKANITINTTRLNNEILKQRLSCIPIHIQDLEMPLQNYVVEVDVENQSDNIIYVTTEQFKIKNITRDEYLSEEDTRNIFPPNSYTGYFIDFVRLRPRISEGIPGERIQLTCELSIGSAKEDGMFNAVSTCSYGYTIDEERSVEILSQKQQEWKDEGKTKEEIAFDSKNWTLLEGQRVAKKDSFDFIIETIGVFENAQLVKTACSILIDKMKELSDTMGKDNLQMEPSINTMKNSYDVILENEDYTVGKVLEFMMYAKYFEDAKTLTFCGFKKMHPHDSDSILRIAFVNETDKAAIKQNLQTCIDESIIIYQTIMSKF